MMTLFVVGPMLLLSGITSPYSPCRRGCRRSTFSPLRYYIDITYGVMLKGAGLPVLWKSVTVPCSVGGTLFGFGMWRFRRQFRNCLSPDRLRTCVHPTPSRHPVTMAFVT
ncbi:MAG: hypothetical protein MRJ92_13120 [Nitrospira sp.]|nr:hypothetical protein [Nitrospira sp.]